MRKNLLWVVLPLAGALFYSCATQPETEQEEQEVYSGWPTYAGSKAGNRYSSNEQITPENVDQLEIAWRYSTGDKDPENHSQIQCNPIIVDGLLYGTSPFLKLFALDAATGEQKWLFDPATAGINPDGNMAWFHQINRGVVYWESAGGDEKRILYSVGPRLFAVNAEDGSLIESFGKGGSIDLSVGLDREGTEDAYIAGTTPGVIYKDLLIMGMRVTEDGDAAPGHIRAFDVRTGERRWIFHTIPHPGEKGYDTWEDPDAWQKIGGANSWAGMSLDEERGIVYVPTGTAGPDFYGGVRKGQNLFANSLLALDAATGNYIWHYQVVHHDLWDRDLPANPNLVTINKDGKQIDAVAQITKHGYIFMFNRNTGEPIFPIEEKPVPINGLPGEKVWPTQPIPTLPEPFARHKFEEEDVSDLTPETHQQMLEKYRQVQHKEMFYPPSKEGSWIFPGYDGGGEWGGAAVDPESGIMYVNSSELPWILTMMDVPEEAGKDLSVKGIGKTVYNKYCISCHGTGLKGNGTSIPDLANLSGRMNEEQVNSIIASGRNMMPAFRQIPESERVALIAFLLNTEDKEAHAKLELAKEVGGAEADNIAGPKNIIGDIPYVSTGYHRFLDKNGYPGIKPPWGTMNAVDLNSGKLLWKVPLGEYEELTRKGIPPTGTENYGGPLVTKGGLVFIAATKDEKIRAFDKKTGKVRWEAKLPAAGYATPATYSLNGRQYVVIACGGGKIGSPSGDQYIAFALPESMK
ncbi:outer membrane protein assembly factor BamB family protein [Pontibacter pamirensis]|uniref:outer membrane protein assembly factor BamB family protein n=1 Tax=Pontibacter pamirensis TaxID=2562824 RepID=UPI00138A5BAC|nr:PQQ-binding-like beta-propeller repeat protein [Pontibacter pamirensis]